VQYWHPKQGNKEHPECIQRIAPSTEPSLSMMQQVGGMAEFSLEIEGNKPLDGRVAAAHLAVCCVLSQHKQHTTLLCVVLILLAFPLLIVEYRPLEVRQTFSPTEVGE
jgi:hypothetical protein